MPRFFSVELEIITHFGSLASVVLSFCVTHRFVLGQSVTLPPRLLSSLSRTSSLPVLFLSGRGFTDKVDRLKLAEIVKQVIEEQTNSHDSQ